jgi:hypothetical protein
MRAVAFAVILAVALTVQSPLSGQSFEAETPIKVASKKPSPRGAFFRSVLIPGWGHHYLGQEHQKRARFHFGSELLLWISYFALDNRATNMQNRMFSYVEANASVGIEGRERAFQLAIGQYNSLQEHNDFMERSRNWGLILPNTPENQWFWENDEVRAQYLELRDNRDRAEQQLPGLVSLMVVNRLISGLNAFTAARKWEFVPELSVSRVGPIQSETNSFLINARFGF